MTTRTPGKTNVYITLTDILKETPEHNTDVVMGHFNAKVRIENKDVKQHLGKRGLGDANKHGKRLLEFCQISDLVLASTFSHLRSSIKSP